MVVQNEEPDVLGLRAAAESGDKADDDATLSLACRHRVDLAVLAVLEPVGCGKRHAKLVVVEREV